MKKAILWAGAAVAAAAVAILAGGRGAVRAQQETGARAGSHFVRLEEESGAVSFLNLDQVAQIDFSDGKAHVRYANNQYSHYEGKPAEQLKAALDRSGRAQASRPAPERLRTLVVETSPLALRSKAEDPPPALPAAPGPGRAGDNNTQGFRFLAYDDFDGKLGLNWAPVRPDPSHVSLTKNPGCLTITTQRGSIHGDEKNDPFGEGVQAKNLTLIDNPLAPGADFVMTTCVRGFTPETSYQQAGLLVYNDDDNYLKFGYEYNWPNQGGQAFCILTETGAKSDFSYVEKDLSGLKRYWVRLTKRGSRYEYATSTDGDGFETHGAVEWGDGAPKRLGILAKNGGNKEAGELDAAFEFFELRAPAPPRAEGAAPGE